MLYSDLFREPIKVRISIYILRFVGHYDEYQNSRLVRSVPLSAIPWC